MKYNLHDVMSKAWEIYHANKQPNGLRPVFSICLEMAWEHVKNSNILNQWQAMSEKEQIKHYTLCIFHYSKTGTIPSHLHIMKIQRASLKEHSL